jgi:crotonobetainyl-CoA:carnitine CoA-transferase CaiB-like acyl-CoA transferase
MAETKHVLEGIRVIELASWVATPGAGTMLADFGAEVIKVESPDGGDQYRQFHRLGGMPRSEIPYTWLLDGRNKKSVAIDLKQKEGAKVLDELITTADVILTSWRPSTLARFRLRYEDLKTTNPRLIYALGTGFGEAGPDADKPGYDVVTFWSRTGLEDTLFPIDGWLGPIPPGIGDHSSAAILFGGIMLALYARARTGNGQKISTSLLANGVYANSILVQAQICGAEFPDKMPREKYPHFVSAYYRARDGRIFRHAAFADHHFPPFCRAAGRPDLIEDPRFAVLEERNAHMPELIAILDDVFAEQDVEYWQAAFEEHDVSYSLISDYEEVGSDPQLEVNRVFVELDHPKYGRLRTVNSPLSLDGEDKVTPRPAPELGEHTREVLSDLGYSSERIDDLLARGVALQYAKESDLSATRGEE